MGSFFFLPKPSRASLYIESEAEIETRKKMRWENEEELCSAGDLLSNLVVHLSCILLLLPTSSSGYFPRARVYMCDLGLRFQPIALLATNITLFMAGYPTRDWSNHKPTLRPIPCWNGIPTKCFIFVQLCKTCPPLTIKENPMDLSLFFFLSTPPSTLLQEQLDFFFFLCPVKWIIYLMISINSKISPHTNHPFPFLH